MIVAAGIIYMGIMGLFTWSLCKIAADAEKG